MKKVFENKYENLINDIKYRLILVIRAMNVEDEDESGALKLVLDNYDTCNFDKIVLTDRGELKLVRGGYDYSLIEGDLAMSELCAIVDKYSSYVEEQLGIVFNDEEE